MIKLISYIEKEEIPLQYYIGTFIFAIFLRNLIETFSSKFIINAGTMIHYFMFYICIALSFILFFSLISKEKIPKIAKIVLTGLSIIPLAPIIDLIITGGKGNKIGYLIPGIHKHIFQRILTLGGKTESIGITFGIKIQIIIILIFSAFYIHLKTKNTLKTILAPIGAYSIIIAYMLSPFLITYMFGIKNLRNQTIYIQIFLLGIVIQLLFLSFKTYKNATIEILKDSRPLLIIFHLLFMISGIILALYNKTNSSNNTIWLQITIISASIFFAAIFSIISNNIIDINSDIVNNKKRPNLITKNIHLYKQFGIIALIISIILVATTTVIQIVLILCLIGNYFFYSIPPLKFKRIPILSKIFMGGNYVIMTLIGYSFFEDIFSINVKFITLIFVVFFLTINFRDIADYKGDKNSEIKTLPVLIGKKRSKIVIGLLFLITYILSSLSFANIKLKILLIDLGVLQFLFCKKKKFSQVPIFVVNFIFIFIITFGFTVLEHQEAKSKNREINTIQKSINAGMNFLNNAQQKNGEFKTFACKDKTLNNCEFDSSPFITSFILYSIKDIDNKYVESIMNKGTTYLISEKKENTLWNYYSKNNNKILPNDIDDTSVISAILSLQGIDTSENLNSIELQRDNKTGAMNTWFSKTFYEIDCEVNTNLLYYYGTLNSTDTKICQYIIDQIQQQKYNCCRYCDDKSGNINTNPLFYTISRAYNSGNKCLQNIKFDILEKTIKQLNQPLTALDLAFSLNIISIFDPENKNMLEEISQELLTLQQNDGSWSKEIFYIGPAPYYASKELTTAIAIEGLNRYELII